jgi:probable phosphoglycerate mutase
MSTRLLLARHGQTRWHAENRYAGSSEVALTDRGFEQARALAGHLAQLPVGERPTALYCSPQERAQCTAAPSAAALGLEVRAVEDLREVHFGMAEGRTRKELRAQAPEVLDRFLEDPVAGAFPGSEPPAQAAQRGADALREIASGHDDRGPVLVVAHNTLVRLSLCRLLGIPLRTYRVVFPLVVNAAISEIGINGEQTSLLRLNHSPRGGDEILFP